MLETLTVIIALIAAFMCFIGVAYTMLQAVSAVKKDDIAKLEVRLEANRREDTARLEANQLKLEKSIADLNTKLDTAIANLNTKFDTYLFGKLAKTKDDEDDDDDK